jgi:hypothetical protein
MSEDRMRIARTVRIARPHGDGTIGRFHRVLGPAAGEDTSRVSVASRCMLAAHRRRPAGCQSSFGSAIAVARAVKDGVA